MWICTSDDLRVESYIFSFLFFTHNDKVEGYTSKLPVYDRNEEKKKIFEHHETLYVYDTWNF